MATKILLSEIVRAQGTADEFAEEVRKHARNLKEHADHHRGKAADFAHRYPAPNPHPAVDLAVKRNDDGTFAPDYEIVDDVAPALFLRKKQERLAAVGRIEHIAAAQIIPPGKARAWALRHGDILRDEQTKLERAVVARDEEVRAYQHSSGILDRAAIMLGLAGRPKFKSNDELAAEILAARGKDDAAFMADYDARMKSMDRLNRHSAQMHAEIEDLTPETVDAWRPSPLKEPQQ